MICPTCKLPLSERLTGRQAGTDGKIQWKYGFCETCQGRAFEFPLLAQHIQPTQAVKLIKLARASRTRSRLGCPECRKTLVETLDQLACNFCQLFWIQNFDWDRYLITPRIEETGAAPKEDFFVAMLRANDMVGQKIKLLFSIFPLLRAKGTKRDITLISFLSDMIIIAFIGVYILPLYVFPLSGAGSGLDPNAMVPLSISPSDLLFYSKAINLGFPVGLASSFIWIKPLSAFFVHMSWLQLIFSICALKIFGSLVEARLGSFRYLCLLLVSTYSGFFCELLTLSLSQSRCYLVGCGGGLAGVIGFYTISLLKERKRKELKAPVFILIAWSFLVIALFSMMSIQLNEVLVYASGGWQYGAVIGGFAALLF